MKLIPTYTYLASGEKLINAYKVTLTKSEMEKAGFKAGDELMAQYKKNKIILIKKEPSD